MEKELQRFTDLRENFKLVRDEIKFDSNFERIFYSCYYCRSNHHWYRCTDHFPNFANLSLARRPHPRPPRLAYPRFNVLKQKSAIR